MNGTIVLLLKGNGGVQRFPQAGGKSAFECKGRRELDCKTLQNESFKRLQSLLTMEFVSTIPINVEAQRRLQFFTNSLFMKMPVPPSVRAMKSFRYLVFTYLKIMTSISFCVLNLSA